MSENNLKLKSCWIPFFTLLKYVESLQVAGLLGIFIIIICVLIASGGS